MSNINGSKYALTALFPIRESDKDGNHYDILRKYLRELDQHPYGSPLSNVSSVHMARFAIIDNLIYQGLPAKRDRLKSRYLLFMCDFDGESVDKLLNAMISQIDQTVESIWQHCVAYPGTARRDLLIAYFEQCQLKTSLFFADRPDDEVAAILRALMSKRQFVQFVEENQRQPPADLKERFYAMWQQLAKQPTPPPGSM